MDTLHIKIKDKETYNHLMWFLKKFDQKELEVYHATNSFQDIKKELQNELRDIDAGTSELVDIEELDKELEKIISAYEP